jgi:hypothetical protein
MWAYGLAFVAGLLLVLYAHAYRGTDLFSLGFCVLFCKAGVSSAFYLSIMAVVSLFKPRHHGAVLGICFGIAYGLTLLGPLLTSLNPSFAALIALLVLSAFALVAARWLRYDFDEERAEYLMDDSLDSIRRLWDELDLQDPAIPPALNPPPREPKQQDKDDNAILDELTKPLDASKSKEDARSEDSMIKKLE